ncbi:MAG: hypothetical protein ABFR75_08030 [Acidobacteriota bacterium]
MNLLKYLKDPGYRFSLLMWLVAIHSFIAGVALIVSSPELFEFFGYKLINERFFNVQGGVFHLVMCVGYSMVALRPSKFEGLVILSISAKFIATFFLLIYSICFDWIFVVFLSGAGDFFMGLAILYFYKKFRTGVKT